MPTAKRPFFNFLVTAYSCIMFEENCLGLADILNFFDDNVVGDELCFVLVRKFRHLEQCGSNK